MDIGFVEKDKKQSERDIKSLLINIMNNLLNAGGKNGSE